MQETGITRPALKAFPLSLVATGKRLLLVGTGCGGSACRLRHALRFDWASIRVILPSGSEPPCDACTLDRRVTIEVREPAKTDVQDADLVLESTMNGATAGPVAAWCRAQRVPLNAMDMPECCDVHYNALVFREPLVIAVSSGGASPALSAALRRWLEEHVGPGWGHAAALLAETRERLSHTPSRVTLLKDLAQDPRFLELIEQDDVAGMEAMILAACERD